MRALSRRVCSSGLTSSQYLTTRMPDSTIIFSKAGTTLRNFCAVSSVQKAFTLCDGGAGTGYAAFTGAPATTIFSFAAISNIRRRDSEYHVGATLDTRLWGDAGFAVTVQYQKTNSNVANYRNKNFSVSFGPTARF